MINTGMTALRKTGATMFSPLYLSYLARACVGLGKFDDASHWISEARVAMQTSKESWWEAEIDRIEGELALKSPLDVARAEVYFERALAVAMVGRSNERERWLSVWASSTHAILKPSSRQQQAKSWELRAAMSLARLWRDQGKVREARELLAPVYGWFREGFNTRDLQDAKALLEELAA
jgi:predicted ATPase